MDVSDITLPGARTNQPLRTICAAAVAALVQVGCASTSATTTRSVPAQRSGGPVRRLVLVEVEGPIDKARFLVGVRKSADFEIEDASAVGVRLAELGEGEVSEAARRFRNEWPADVYVRLGLNQEDGHYHPVHAYLDYGWETSRIDIAMRDARTGRLLANLSAAESEDWASSDAFRDSFRHPAEVRPPWVAADAATAKAMEAAVKLSLENLEGRPAAK